mmetsp:Transcript_23666/g.42844  ORF Transcript_23666/g.42844 Transcript_23666/m.42844 type:complete len:368 (-) Transcript_23666:56-1159(-)
MLIELVDISDGLLGSLAACLYAQEIVNTGACCRKARMVFARPERGLCCPHLFPATHQAMCAALLRCDARQLQTLRPLGEIEFDSSTYLSELLHRLPLLTSLEELGPLCIDTSGGPVLLMQKAGVGPEAMEGSVAVRPRKVLPVLAASFPKLHRLASLSLTLRCLNAADAKIVSEVFMPALGSCQALRHLRLDLDTPLSCGAAMTRGLVAMLQKLSSWQKLESLSLGYLWWTEAAEETLDQFKEALQAFKGSVRAVAIRCPQDQELGALDAVAASLLLGVASNVEEVLAMQAWGDDGTGLSKFLEVLSSCRRLRRVDFIGELPNGLDRASLESSLRAARPAAEMTAKVCVNTPAGWRRASCYPSSYRA